ncbi:cell surface protein SprA [Salinibacter ruber]|nr:cell surface protein SprA [Salinibacter ruber]MBB4068347.1 cell surface protein SprA [Salinibacter ruber]MCS3711377.1 cell surface protein SprA [Salinibacter ruber]MCS3754926.1 cell surface protein SprA [Salinibacter ruber]MCS3935731.1 cell surface protein SprA [Salinibacter ruber]MCS4045879.1 cell surface protein SprA [Salinibacter ruber]
MGLSREGRVFMSTVALFLIGSLAGGESPARAQEGPPPDTTVPDTTAPDTTRRTPVLQLEGLPPPPGDSASLSDRVGGLPRTEGEGLSAPSPSPDTGVVGRYLPARRKRAVRLFGRASPFLGPRAPTAGAQSVTLDSTQNRYVLTGDTRPGERVGMDADAYRQERYRANLRENWRTLTEQRQQGDGRSGFGVNMVVPGGRESAFSTVFGKPQVDLRVNGQADINAGFKYRKSDQQVNVTGNASQLNPDFKQDLRLGITGTIGDKLQINVDWDTQSQFDYQNQVKLDYTGYEDEILQSVEAGNVSMQTPSQLISGGQSLFGIKSEFQFGNLSLTTIASQQEGQSNSLSIEGGAQETEFDLKPTDYDENRHFFLGYYFRNNWNRAHEDPTTIRTFGGFDEITEVEVWKITQQVGSQANTRQAVAVVDLGERARLVNQANDYTETLLPVPEEDQYGEADLTALRDGEQRASSYLSDPATMQQPLDTQQDLHAGEFKRLARGQDYRIDGRLGFLSLQQRLRPDEALAVAFRYRTNDGTVRTVGDFTQGGTTGGINADRLVLKLLRPTDPVAPGQNGTVNPAAWFLQLRNVYDLSGRDFNPENFELDVEYQASGQGARTTLPDVAGQTTLLQVLGLDRVDQNGAPNPDDQFDFLPQTINADRGLLYFPYLQPFGARILDAAAQNGSQAAGESFAFENLYTKKKANARKEDTQKNVYRIRGSYTGGAQQFYDLEAFTGLVEGSVEVTSGGQTLQEGVDYRVDYQGGTVNITNESYLTAGRDIMIDYEQNSLTNIQKKTLLGARADWSMRDQFSLGATVMRLSQQSPVDKFRIGQEPIQNTIWGLNGSMDLQPQWITEAVDALPLVQTRAESQLSVSGEFAQLRPGHTTTDAYERTVDRVENSETDQYASDERNGVSYIDDFEGFENTFSLREQPGAWQVSAAPDSTADAALLDGEVPGTYEDNRQRTHWRGRLGWYRLNENVLESIGTEDGGEATELINTEEVFVGRDTQGEANPTLRTLDLHFNPWQRGPYNYTEDLVDFFREPRKVWGGITRSLPEGYTDFSVQNVEFVEFIVKVYPENGEVTDGARLFVDLGTISEDVVPNQRIDMEDGLSLSFNEADLGDLSRIPNAEPGGGIDLRGRRTQDLGLDGLVSYTDGAYDERLLERSFYSGFVAYADSLQGAIGQLGLSTAQRQRLRAEIARTAEDPSADDYHFYENDRFFDASEFFPDGASVQQRLSWYQAGHELNGFESQNELAEDASVKRGVSRSPDREALDGVSSQINIDNNYFQYAVPLDELDQRAGADRGPTDYVVSRVGQEKDWYKVRIPVQEFTRQVGSIENFDDIKSIRLWTTGHEAPVTMRFASLELVGSQWRVSEPVAQQPVQENSVVDAGTGELRVASINNEEDLSYEPPAGAVVGQNRTSRGVQQQNREQALLLNVDQLAPGRQRGVFKTFGQGLDLLKYSNLRMYTHLHGASSSTQVKDRLREHLRLFVRLGSGETGDYYEYEQPLSPGDVPMADGSQNLWPEEFEMNLVLERLNRLKLLRDQSGVPTDTSFSSADVNLDIGDFAPPETVLRVRGTPSLQNVKTIVVGVRHATPPEENPPVLQNFEVWLNELRVSGFDEQKGWAANASASLDLADFASVEGSFQRRTDGFGALSSTLSEREQSDNTSWNLRASLNVDSFLPEDQGWRIPVTMQVQSNRTTPRFDPNRGDVEVQSVVRQFDAVPDSTLESRYRSQYGALGAGEIRRRLKDSVRTAAETRSLRRTMTADVSKQGSDSWWLQKTVDGLSLSFSYLDQSRRNPQRQLNDRWSWTGDLQYQLSFGQPRTVDPFGFLPDAPVLGTLAGLSFNYVPRSLSFSMSAEREAQTTRSRPSGVRNTRSQPYRIAYSLREQQQFDHRRNFSLQYDPFGFLSLSFDTNTRQNFDDAASRNQTNVIINGESVRDTVLTDIGIPRDSTANFFDRLGDYGLADRDITAADEGETVFFESRLFRRSELDVFRDLLVGRVSPRTNNYQQRFSATLSMGWTDRPWLNWIDLQDLSYQSSFQWSNGPAESLQGASVRNSLTLRTGATLRPNRVWERFGFFERLKEAQRESGRDDPEDGGRSTGDNGDDRGDDDGEASEGDGLGWEDVPLPSPMGMLRGLALMVLDINDFSVNYNGDWSARSSNVGRLNSDSTDVEVHYRLLDAVRGDGPSVGYRLGLDRSIGAGRRVLDSRFQVSDALSNTHRLEGRTALSPSPSFQIDLSWNVEWRTQTDRTFQAGTGEPGNEGEASDGPFTTESGDNSASVWGFGSVVALVEEQARRLPAGGSGAGEVLPAAEVPLTNASVADDFKSAYLTGGGSVGAHGFAPFPLPGWNIRYSGLADWPLLGRIVESASLRHSYNAEYQSSYATDTRAGDEVEAPNGQTFLNPDFKVGSARVSEQFRPLLGVSITWPGNLETSVEWSRQTETYLRTANLKVEEVQTNQLSGSVSYRKQGIRIPVLGLGRLENQIRFSLTVSRSVNDERSYNLRGALADVQDAGGSVDPGQVTDPTNDYVQVRKQTTRIQVTPELTYRLSDRVTGELLVEYERFNGDNRQPSYTRVNGGFNVSVSISQN